MSSSAVLRSRRLRRWLPWLAYAAAAIAVVPLARSATGLGASPAVAEGRRVTLGCPRTAHRLWVAEVLVTPGQAVAAGQVLVRMAPGELDVELAIARGRLAELELAAVRAGSRLAVDSDRMAVALGRLAAEEQQDRSELAELETAIARETSLAADRLVDGERLGALRLRRAGLAARARELEGAVAQARRGASAAGERLAEWRRVQGAPPDPRRPPRAGTAPAPAGPAVEAQRAQVAGLEALRERLELRAPFAGRVEAVLLRPGEVATDEGAVLTLVEEHPATAVAWVDERWATRVHEGDRVRLAPRDGAGPAAGGRVEALGPGIAELPARFWLAPAQPRYGRAVYVRLDGPAFLPGQALEASFSPPRDGGS